MYESERLSKGIEVGSLSQQYSSTQLMQMTSNWVRTGTEQVALKKQMGQHVRRKRQRLSRAWLGNALQLLVLIHDFPKVKRVQSSGEVFWNAILGSLEISLNQIAYFVVKLLTFWFVWSTPRHGAITAQM